MIRLKTYWSSTLIGKEFKCHMVKDPVCGMDVDPNKTSLSSVYQGQNYYFCSSGCKKAFDKDPHKFVGNNEGSHTAHHH
jgi:Cu+-exporting ATPase